MEEFYRKSLILGKEYNFFNTVKIKNLNQAAAYIEAGIFPVDIRVCRNEQDKRMIVYYFDKDESKEVFDKWCNYEL